MSNPAAANIIRQALIDGPLHPGDDKNKPFVVALPMFQQAAKLPPELAKEFAEDAGLPDPDVAKLTSEALVAKLEEAFVLRTVAEDEDARRAVASLEHQRHRTIAMHCHCGTKLFEAAVIDFDTANARISPNVITALRSIDPSCATKHGVA